MIENQNYKENSFIPKESLTHGRMHFEPGNHDAHLNAYQKFLNGDLTTHFWNSEVTNRMNNYQPGLISIDSLDPIYSSGELAGYSTYDIGKIWTMLPDRPAKINQNGKINVLLGDISYYSIKNKIYHELFVNKRVEEDLIQKLDTEMIHEDSSIEDKDQAQHEKQMGLELGIGLSSMALDALSHVILKPNAISRRHLLKVVSIAGLAVPSAIGAQVLGEYQAPVYTRGEKTKDILGDIFSWTTDFDLFKMDWVQGRSALLIAKNIDAVNNGLSYGGKDSAVLMGSGHMEGVQHLLRSGSDRKNAIKKMAENMATVIDKINNKYEIMSERGIRNVFLDTVVSYNVVTVKDPGISRLDHLTEKNILGLVDFEDRARVSSEVADAVASLRR